MLDNGKNESERSSLIGCELEEVKRFSEERRKGAD